MTPFRLTITYRHSVFNLFPLLQRHTLGNFDLDKKNPWKLQITQSVLGLLVFLCINSSKDKSKVHPIPCHEGTDVTRYTPTALLFLKHQC